MCAPTMGIIHEEEIHPTRPVEHATDKSEQGLASLSLDENTDHHHHQAHESHSHASTQQLRAVVVVLQYSCHQVNHGHASQYHAHRHDGFPPI
ncbi:hypothetical protein HMPREF9303_0421 [Prevotella denticola CRIS 18C-A]|uniref:Uncharacterized protein n=1 Tax=Prevotella denticola CRIS 18C-A TaxID=944557 RepID=F0H4C4_9BACT|nr:hypothetical protein HMPREF9303_0421 [Prevotella denticola CRIS 18C-A]